MEQEKVMWDTRKSLRMAMVMEGDKRRFYITIGRMLTPLFDDRLFRILADHATDHLRMLRDIYEVSGGPDALLLEIPTLYELETPWDKCMKRLTSGEMSDAKVLESAADLQLEDAEFYHDLAVRAINPFEKNFYYAMARDEKKDFLMVQDVFSYTVDPEGWFETIERIVLDGG